MKPEISPNGGSTRERRKLEERFEGRLAINPLLTRKTVSYQGNRRVPGFRWMKYYELPYSTCPSRQSNEL